MTLKGVLAFLVAAIFFPILFMGFVAYVAFLAKLMGVYLQ